MVQSGYNAGPRNARVFGLAVSYSRKLSDADKRLHDTDVVGLSGIMWSVISALMPSDLVRESEQALSKHALPRFATRYVDKGV